MSYKPGDTFRAEFTTSSPTTGAATNADSLPTATANHNGTDDGSFSLTVVNLDTGRYKVTGTVPAYSSGDTVVVTAAATVSSVAAKAVIATFVVDAKRVADLQDPTVASIQSGLALHTDATAIESTLSTIGANVTTGAASAATAASNASAATTAANTAASNASAATTAATTAASNASAATSAANNAASVASAAVAYATTAATQSTTAATQATTAATQSTSAAAGVATLLSDDGGLLTQAEFNTTVGSLNSGTIAGDIHATPVIQILPLTSVVGTGEVKANKIVAYQTANFGPFTFTIVDSNGQPNQLNGHSLTFVASTRAGVYLWELTGCPVSGASNNIVTVSQASNANTLTAADLLFTLWDTTTNKPVARGTLLIDTAVAAQ